MAIGLSSTLNSLLLSPYAQTALQAAQPRGAVDPIRPGSTITARYTIEEDGALSLRDVSVVDEAADSTSEQSQQKQKQTAEQNQKSFTFADLARPKATLNPSDEVALFASTGAQAQLQLAAPEKVAPRNANGASITDIETGDSNPQLDLLSLAAQKQQKVAGLYARNADITYNVDPVYSAAA